MSNLRCYTEVGFAKGLASAHFYRLSFVMISQAQLNSVALHSCTCNKKCLLTSQMHLVGELPQQKLLPACTSACHSPPQGCFSSALGQGASRGMCGTPAPSTVDIQGKREHAEIRCFYYLAKYHCLWLAARQGDISSQRGTCEDKYSVLHLIIFKPERISIWYFFFAK